MNFNSLLGKKSSKYSYSIILKWLWQSFLGFRIQFLVKIFIGLLYVAVSLSTVWAVQHAIDVASENTSGSVYYAVGLIGILVSFDIIIDISNVWMKNTLVVRAQNIMRERMLDRILRTEWRGLENIHSGDLLNRLEFDINSVVTFLTETVPDTMSVIILLAGAFFYLLNMDNTLAWIIIIIIPLFIFISKLYVCKMRAFIRKIRNTESKVQSILQETIQHKMLIKTLECNDFMVDKLRYTQIDLSINVIKRTIFFIFSKAILDFGFAFGYILAFLWGAIRMSHNTLTFGGMIAFLQLVNKIQGPARSLTKIIPSFVSVLIATERLIELEEPLEEKQGLPLQVKSPVGIRVQNISYMYNGNGSNVIEDLSFDFKPCSCTAVIGETGSGKTTLFRILLALLKPQEGKIELYGKNGTFDICSLSRCNFVYVPQGNTMLSGTIRDNLMLGKLDATDNDIAKALHISCADFVYDLPSGLDTFCTEQGGGLSEGQSQRISIARALLRNRSIMLLDEATSALDIETEKELLNNIMSLNDKTIIFITHRKVVVDYCDQILNIN